MKQLSLIEDPIEADFRTFHRDHPDVYAALARLARQWRDAGNRTGSIALLFEVLRWEQGLGDHGADFALNNNYRSRYARLLMHEPDLDGFFNVRQLHVDRGEAA